MANLLNEWIDAFCKGCEIYNVMQVAEGLAPAFPKVDKDQFSEQGDDHADYTFAVLNPRSRPEYWWDDQRLFLLRKN
jgi:hypothetical protein